ncbi:MAG: hypothetical protein M5U07_13390 [Xanthobacteraceae bacterium]|nr:hypothetical protein [Xanthobacteraceae bacterium]
MRLAAIAMMIMAASAGPSAAQEPVRLHAAGSLRAALNDVIKAFGAETRIEVAATSVPLPEELAVGATGSP